MTTFFGQTIKDIPLPEFFMLPESIHEDIWRWQQRNTAKMRAWIGSDTPPYWIAVAQGRFLLWPVMPSGARIVAP